MRTRIETPPGNFRYNANIRWKWTLVAFDSFLLGPFSGKIWSFFGERYTKSSKTTGLLEIQNCWWDTKLASEKMLLRSICRIIIETTCPISGTIFYHTQIYGGHIMCYNVIYIYIIYIHLISPWFPHLEFKTNHSTSLLHDHLSTVRGEFDGFKFRGFYHHFGWL